MRIASTPTYLRCRSERVDVVDQPGVASKVSVSSLSDYSSSSASQQSIGRHPLRWFSRLSSSVAARLSCNDSLWPPHERSCGARLDRDQTRRPAKEIDFGRSREPCCIFIFQLSTRAWWSLCSKLVVAELMRTRTRTLEPDTRRSRLTNRLGNPQILRAEVDGYPWLFPRSHLHPFIFFEPPSKART
jgi:hypothetical protein